MCKCLFSTLSTFSGIMEVALWFGGVLTRFLVLDIPQHETEISSKIS